MLAALLVKVQAFSTPGAFLHWDCLFYFQGLILQKKMLCNNHCLSVSGLSLQPQGCCTQYCCPKFILHWLTCMPCTMRRMTIGTGSEWPSWTGKVTWASWLTLALSSEWLQLFVFMSLTLDADGKLSPLNTLYSSFFHLLFIKTAKHFECSLDI